jgi:hypothetical protein
MMQIMIDGKVLTDEQVLMVSRMAWCMSSEYGGALPDDEERVLEEVLGMVGSVLMDTYR